VQEHRPNLLAVHAPPQVDLLLVCDLGPVDSRAGQERAREIPLDLRSGSEVNHRYSIEGVPALPEAVGRRDGRACGTGGARAAAEEHLPLIVPLEDHSMVHRTIRVLGSRDAHGDGVPCPQLSVLPWCDVYGQPLCDIAWACRL
jgi:hypothetical protein